MVAAIVKDAIAIQNLMEIVLNSVAIITGIYLAGFIKMLGDY
ncbi:hypothetical protein [Nostoc sp. 'Lobaria pulmonaria (5183) cyanobiont']|nr:hypothetical protein [Nostoc sp. 'Lobaria pulmonaria (5183) cyanobiont']